MEKLKYDSLYKFIVSIGIAIIILPFIDSGLENQKFNKYAIMANGAGITKIWSLDKLEIYSLNFIFINKTLHDYKLSF